MKWNISIYLSTYILILFGYVSGSPKKRKIDEQLKTYFENLSQNVFASAGQNVMLPCRVRHLNDKVVSWIRMRDLHILTSGSFLFTNDGRFGIHHPLKDSAIWNLEIKDVSQKDMGSYECQVNTEPKIKFLVNLTVFESDVMIGDMGEDSTTGNGKFEENNKNQEPSERRMTPGGSVSFTCVLNHFNQTRPSIQWNHNNESISIHGHKSSISIETERSLNNFISRLTLANVSKYDSGKYTCISGHQTSITFILHVILPENELALQDGLRSEASSIMNYFNLIVAIFLNTIITM
ncbi:lachesin-like isoform X2 [Daktulosphaira vitifoliae]|uniref:lachesin-like isoform X2 n=1 Tax=Daktulosphaira vitifoliae TaxID=58002 RepID=UPI0021AA2A6F|nr:lachesin-like isoform X2 [Daktulosphaira vitifoliae]